MKRTSRLLVGIAALCLATPGLVTPASAQDTPMRVNPGDTVEVCQTLTVTASSAYTAGNEVGGLIALAGAFRAMPPPNVGLQSNSGILQSIRLNTKDAQTVGFKAYEFSTNPSHSTWTDKVTPSINAADVFTVLPPLTLANSDSGLGTQTVYGADAIARAHRGTSSTDYWVIVTSGTPTFGSTSDVQFCASYLQQPN